MLRLLVLLIPVFLTAGISAAERPNVVVILSDDQGWGDFSGNGNSNLSTPHVDSLAREGASVERFYVCPVCAPTRAEFLTGRYHPRGGVRGVSTGEERLDLDETTIADEFRAAGYATGAFGKWHNGMQYPYHPNGRGFDEYYGFCSGHWGQYFDPLLERNGQLLYGEGFCVDDFTNQAMTFIEQSVKRKQPFFAYLPYNTPHSPMQVPDRFYDKFDDANLEQRNRDPNKEDLEHTRAALAMCENIDWNVGRLLKQLDQLRIADNTIVVYFCDNGPNGWRWNNGMKGKKGSTDEGGVRSPLFIRWPGQIPAGQVVKQNAAAIDLLPTLLDLTGIERNGEQPLDGLSMKPALQGTGELSTDRTLFSHWNKKVSARHGRFCLDHTGKLYDLRADPGQNEDVSQRYPAQAKEMRAAVQNWKSEMLAGLGEDDRPFLIGHPDYRFNQIPARDGIPHGAIERSDNSPNCTYFTNWTNPKDYISWDVEVPADGRFRVEVYYTCPVDDVGSQVELRFNDNAVTGIVQPAHDPPKIGAEYDRIPRTQSYVKHFKPLDLGEIELKKGKGELTLKALSMPGDEVMEVRLLMLTRVK